MEERRRSTLPLIAIYAVLSLITNFPSGFTNSTVNTSVEELHRFINSSYVNRGSELSAGSVALFQSATLNCWFVAQVFGSMFTPYITDMFGRRIGYMVAVAITIGATLVQYFSVVLELPEGLILGRSLTALSSQLGDVSLLLYVQETSPLGIRGMASFFCEIGYGAMCVLGMVLGMRSVLGSSLERLILVSIIPEILSFMFLFFIPETPKYLMIIKGDRKEAMESLNFFQGRKKENEDILDDYQREKLQENNSDKSSFMEVFRTWHLRQAVLLSCSVLILTLSFYPILQSSTYFFSKSGLHMELAEISSIVLLTLFTVSSVIGATFIDRFPRRFLIIFFGALTNVFLICFSIFSATSHLHPLIKYACLASMCSYIISFGMVLPLTIKWSIESIQTFMAVSPTDWDVERYRLNLDDKTFPFSVIDKFEYERDQATKNALIIGFSSVIIIDTVNCNNEYFTLVHGSMNSIIEKETGKSLFLPLGIMHHHETSVRAYEALAMSLKKIVTMFPSLADRRVTCVLTNNQESYQQLSKIQLFSMSISLLPAINIREDLDLYLLEGARRKRFEAGVVKEITMEEMVGPHKVHLLDLAQTQSKDQLIITFVNLARCKLGYVVNALMGIEGLFKYERALISLKQWEANEPLSVLQLCGLSATFAGLGVTELAYSGLGKRASCGSLTGCRLTNRFLPMADHFDALKRIDIMRKDKYHD